ncbi:hypothetical protein P5673_002281, partial [Acropora cervicornis]
MQNFHITRVELPKELTKTLTEEPTKVGVAFPAIEKPVNARQYCGQSGEERGSPIIK